jgi:biotin synthase
LVSAISQAYIDKYLLLEEEEKILRRAYLASDVRTYIYCMVCNGYAPTRKELECLCPIVSRIKQEVVIKVCMSVGFFTEGFARMLKQAGVDRYNHNLTALCQIVWKQLRDGTNPKSIFLQ